MMNGRVRKPRARYDDYHAPGNKPTNIVLVFMTGTWYLYLMSARVDLFRLFGTWWVRVARRLPR